jgi:hypothetical protein
MMILLVSAFVGCGSVVVSSSSGTGGQTSNEGTGGTTISVVTTTSDSTSTTTSTTTGAGGSTCEILGAAPCDGTQDLDIYPDSLASYNASQPYGFFMGPILETPEVGEGAGVVRLGPFAEDRDFVGFTVEMGTTLPDPLRFAAWTEPQCGLPADSPHDHTQDVALADTNQEDLVDSIRVGITTPIHVIAGQSAYLAVVTTTVSVSFHDVQPTGPMAPRAMWWGIVDNDCDGMVDPDLGYAYLDSPTAPGVFVYHRDLPFALVE